MALRLAKLHAVKRAKAREDRYWRDRLQRDVRALDDRMALRRASVGLA